MNSSGEIRTFSTGSTRDSSKGKPRMELLPMELLMRVADWYALGAEKYGDNNYRKGQPQSAVVGSLLRHLTKYIQGLEDEDHLSAIIWNALCLMNDETYYKDNPEICDLKNWFKDGKPTGEGSYENKIRKGNN